MRHRDRLLIAVLVTMLACTVVIGLLPADAMHHSAASMVEAACRLWGPTAGLGLALVATVSCFGVLNGWVMLQAQTPLEPAQDGLFPRRSRGWIAMARRGSGCCSAACWRAR